VNEPRTTALASRGGSVDRRARSLGSCQTSLVHSARLLALVVIVAGCGPRPSANLQLEEPQPKPEVAEDSEAKGQPQVDARMQSVCEHSYEVLASESPAMRSPEVERDFIARCVAGNQTKRAELGEAQWAARAACIELAKTGDELGSCDGRTPRAEPNPSVESFAIGDEASVRALCQRVFDVLLKENPDMAQVFGPTQMEPLLEQCAADVERSRAENPEKFDREARCIMAAQSVADFEKCDEG
jgi:hypothetical protein